jgi:hypothetical protein
MEMNEKEERTNLIWTVLKMVTHNPHNQHSKKCSKEEKTQRGEENSKNKGKNDFFP